MTDTSPPAKHDAELVEELRATVQMKDHLLQMVSHEMRTPLLSITNFSGTMLDRWDAFDDGSKREFLGIINQQAHRLSRLVHDLLAVARMEAGRLRTVTERVNLRDVANETIRELGGDATSVSVNCDPQLAVTADRDHVKQILVNYISNAMKYGAAPVTVDAATEQECVRFWVEDRGEGISDEFRPQLFEKFAQGGNASNLSGSGLGLSIVEGLAHAQNGSAWYEPLEGGSRFGVTLPHA